MKQPANPLPFSSLLLVVGAIALLAAPQEKKEAEAQTEPQMSHAEVSQIARQIQRRILTLPNHGVFDNITFDIRGRTVTLAGQASRPTLRKSAERVVKDIEGLDEVINHIEVLPLSRRDDEIRTRVYLAVYGHPALSRYNPNRGAPLFNSLTRRTFGLTEEPPIGFHPIHIVVKNGNVVLEGIVDNSGDKTIAGIQANGVFGVFSVTNDLVVANRAKEKMMKSKKKKK